MTQPDQALFDLDDLPLPQRLAAQALSAGLDYLSAIHSQSWELGVRAGLARAQESYEATRAPSSTVKLTLGYGDLEHHRSGNSIALFGNDRLQISAEARTAIRGDCSRLLGADEQPTGEQWKVILSVSPTTLMTGAAGTGKSRTLLFRALLLHRYLKVPLNHIQILTFSREARVELATELLTLFQRFGLSADVEDVYKIVMTPRSSLLAQVHALPDLSSVIPFEVYNLAQTESGVLADGRPFEPSVGHHQREEMTKCLNHLYRTNKRFADAYQALWAASLRLPTLEVDSPEVVKRAPLGWKLSEFDIELCDAVENLWREAKAWPIEGVTPGRKTFILRGRPYCTHGYIAQLGLHVVLGFDRREGPSLTRGPSANLALYKEVAVKRTLLQAYFPEGVIHLDSYDEAVTLAESLKVSAKAAPPIHYSLKGASSPTPLIDSFNTTATLLDSLGLEIASLPSKLNFLPDDSDALYFEVLSVFWQALERHLLALPSPVVPFGRLFSMLGAGKGSALRHVPGNVLDQCRHMLIDGAEDQPVPVALWVRSVIAEIRRRDSAQSKAGSGSLTVTGDTNQWVFGTWGASPRLLTEFDDHFQSPLPATKAVLGESFRSPQGLIEAAFNLVQHLGTSHNRAPRSVFKGSSDDQVVTIEREDPAELIKICGASIAASQKLLILINSDLDKSWVDTAIGDIIREDRAASRKAIRVRSVHKAKALEADVVVLVGDPSTGSPSWYRNQLYKLAGFGSGGDLTPGDTVHRGEALRLAYVALTRAKIRCYWFPNRTGGDGNTASTSVGLLPGLFKDRR